MLPEIKQTPTVFDGPAGSLSFYFTAPSGETVTVAGDFNGWDPFMHRLTETAPGRYSLTLPLPAGTYRYVFCHRGERLTDPNNRNTVYDKYGNSVSEAVLK
jgi:1,4-alpha-glucan branching enzyme